MGNKLIKEVVNLRNYYSNLSTNSEDLEDKKYYDGIAVGIYKSINILNPLILFFDKMKRTKIMVRKVKFELDRDVYDSITLLMED